MSSPMISWVIMGGIITEGYGGNGNGGHGGNGNRGHGGNGNGGHGGNGNGGYGENGEPRIQREPSSQEERRSRDEQSGLGWSGRSTVRAEVGQGGARSGFSMVSTQHGQGSARSGSGPSVSPRSGSPRLLVARGLIRRLTPSIRRGTLKLINRPAGHLVISRYVSTCA
jgi:hypothetical protein